MTIIPEDIHTFLYWVKDRTEAYWANNSNLINPLKDDTWLHGAKWIGLEEAQIDEIEIKYSIWFTLEHRAFLKVLHTLDRKKPLTEDHVFETPDGVLITEKSMFYNWLTDDGEIRMMLHWPYKTILHDVLKSTWLDSWGEILQSPLERERIFAEWYKQAPELLPLYAHRFLISEPQQGGNPVLSVWGADTIVYGWDLRSYLLSELEVELGLTEPYFDEEDQEWYCRTIKEAQLIRDHGNMANKEIPFWGELIEYSSGGWVYSPSEWYNKLDSDESDGKK
jgi:hypothetical protein